MKRTLIVFLLVNLILLACAPASAPTLTPAPSATSLPTATAAPTSTATPNSTPAPTATSTAAPTASAPRRRSPPHQQKSPASGCSPPKTASHYPTWEKSPSPGSRCLAQRVINCKSPCQGVNCSLLTPQPPSSPVMPTPSWIAACKPGRCLP